MVYANFWIAIGSSCLAWQMALMNGQKFTIELGLFIFFATLFSYNFQRLTRHSKKNFSNDSLRVRWIKKHRLFLVLIAIIAAFMSLIFSFQLNIDQLIYLVVPGMISIFYALGTIGLRNIPGMKIVWIGLVWAFTVGISMIPSKIDLNFGLIYFSTFTFIVSLCIPFDIRDLSVDSKKQKTIPQMIGKKWAIINALFFFSLSYVIWIYLSQNWLLIAPFVLGFLMILNVLRKKQPELYFSGLIDGQIIITSCIFIITHGI